MKSNEIVHDSTELRKLIAENPKLPIVVLAKRENLSDDYAYTYCNSVHAHKGELLEFFGKIYDDRGEYREAVGNDLADWDEYASLNDEEFEKEVDKYVNQHESDWQQAIIIYAGGELMERKCENCTHDEVCSFRNSVSAEECVFFSDGYVHSAWITFNGVSRCGYCEYIPPYDSAIDDIFCSDYCPNCGARMDGESEESNERN